MVDKVVEPSEIIIEQDYVHTNPARANPWIRCLARFMDYSLFCLAIFIWELVFHEKIKASFFETIVPMEFLAWIPIEALFLVIWGKTPGKWFLKTTLQFGKKKRPDLILALKRSLSVWWRGMGLGIPVINFLCLLTAYHRLRLTQTTSWDREDHIHVVHHPIARWRLITAAIFGIGGLFIYSAFY